MEKSELITFFKKLAAEYGVDERKYLGTENIITWHSRLKDTPTKQVYHAYEIWFNEGNEFPPKLVNIIKLINSAESKATYFDSLPMPENVFKNKFGEWEDEEGRVYDVPGHDFAREREKRETEQRFKRDMSLIAERMKR